MGGAWGDDIFTQRIQALPTLSIAAISIIYNCIICHIAILNKLRMKQYIHIGHTQSLGSSQLQVVLGLF